MFKSLSHFIKGAFSLFSFDYNPVDINSKKILSKDGLALDKKKLSADMNKASCKTYKNVIVPLIKRK